jgi:hypothetical protein
VKASVKKLWVKALRSGKYKQGQDDDSERWCCLGVLCDVFGRATGKRVWKSNGRREFAAYGTAAFLPVKVQSWACCDNDPVIVKRKGITASECNDDKGKSFKQIAALVEKNL